LATVVVQACPHVPQLPGSVALFVQVIPQRSGVEPPQLDVQDAPEHTGVGFEQAVPHAPQLPFSVRDVGQPRPASAQSAKPAAQV
jgi:hypothetical protein